MVNGAQCRNFQNAECLTAEATYVGFCLQKTDSKARSLDIEVKPFVTRRDKS